MVQSITNVTNEGITMEQKTDRIENMRGGDGHAIIRHILGKEQMNDKCKMYAQVTLEPGCSIGYHEHHAESETYYFLSGEGIYDDNGTKRSVRAGDVTVTPDGMGHGIANAGGEDLVFMALILSD